MTPDDPRLFQVLVADDDAAARAAIRTSLSKAGYRVSEADDGESAWEMILKDKPHVLICDVNMPRLSGEALLQRLVSRGLSQSVYVIMATAEPDATAQKLLDLGADDFLRKPVKLEELRARVKAGCRISGLVNKLLRRHEDLFAAMDALIVQDGGCAPGYDPVTAFLCDTLERLGHKVFVAAQGFKSVVTGGDQDYVRLVYDPAQYQLLENVPGVMFAGPMTVAAGASFRTERYPQFKEADKQRQAAENIRKRGVKVLVGVGGNGTLAGLLSLRELLEPGIACYFIPVTIDSDVFGTECIGEHTGVEVGAQKIRGYMADARTHNRIYVIEMMGASSGFHALHSCLGARAHLAVLPGMDLDLELVARKLETREYAVIVVAEGYARDERKAQDFKDSAAHFLMHQLQQRGIHPKRRIVCEAFSRDIRGAEPNNQDIALCQRMAHLIGGFVREGRQDLMPCVNGPEDGELSLKAITTDNRVCENLGHLARRLLD